MTIQDFLLGCAGNYPIEENTINYICLKRNVSPQDVADVLDKRDRDMLEVEMLRFLLRAPGMTGSVQDANGTWSHKEGAVEMNSIDKKHLAARLKELEAEYGLANSSIKIHKYGMRLHNVKKGI